MMHTEIWNQLNNEINVTDPTLPDFSHAHGIALVPVNVNYCTNK